MRYKYSNDHRDGRDGVRLLKTKGDEANWIPRYPDSSDRVEHIPVPDSDDDKRLSMNMLPTRRRKMAEMEIHQRESEKVVKSKGPRRAFKNATDQELALIIQGKL